MHNKELLTSCVKKLSKREIKKKRWRRVLELWVSDKIVEPHKISTFFCSIPNNRQIDDRVWDCGDGRFERQLCALKAHKLYAQSWRQNKDFFLNFGLIVFNKYEMFYIIEFSIKSLLYYVLIIMMLFSLSNVSFVIHRSSIIDPQKRNAICAMLSRFECEQNKKEKNKLEFQFSCVSYVQICWKWFVHEIPNASMLFKMSKLT